MDFATIKDFIKLGRGLSYVAIIWYLLGTLFAVYLGAQFDIVKFVIGYFIVLPGILVGTLTNSYYDIAVDSLSNPTPVSGGTKVLSERPELLAALRNFIILCFCLSVGIGLVFTIVFSFPVTFFAIVLFANVLAWAYTAPPLRLVYRGFGELVTLIEGGFMMLAIGYYATMGTINLPLLLFSIPIMLTMFAFAFYVEIPDRDADFKGNKKTLVVRVSEKFGFVVGSLSLAAATLCFLVYYIFDVFPGSSSLLIVGLYSMVPVVFALNGLGKYMSDPATKGTSVLRSSVSILSAIIFMDVYFAFLILV